MTRFQICFSVILSCFASVLAFNLDVDNLVRYRGHSGSMFGFTVAQHSFQTQNWIIVGAPEDQTSQVGVTRGGAVYRCNVTGDSCEQIIFDKHGDNKDPDGNHIDSKSNQWFGATLTSSNGSVLACAPRYVYTQPTSAEERRDPVGTCWLAKDQLNRALEFSPCRNRDWGYHRHGHCQAGLGAALSKDGGRVYIGAPGSCFWQGQVHSVAATTKLPFVPPKVIIIDAEGKIHSQNTHNRADVIASSDGPYTDDDSYLGYSVTSGRFDGGLEAPAPSDIAVGVPKGERLNGKVVLFTYNMTHIRNITGEQLGAYFGYAMAACDIDGNGYDDLIVGAPMYTEEGNHEGFFETGRIYVFYAGHADEKDVRDGDKSNRARFGHSIACLGDVNSDGFNDFAVGAPYEKDGERGAVYIYHGSKAGVREKYSQVIRAEDIPGNPLTFGFSVAGGIDMDRNQYPDLSVGAYESNQAFLFKARPVVEMHSTVTFESESKQIALEEQNCTLKDRTRVPCVKLDACLKYDGLGVDSRLPFEIQVLLDARKPKSPRLAFLSEEGRNALNQTMWLEKGRKFCNSYWVYLKTNIRDKLTSLDAELWYTLINNQNPRIARSLTPVLNANENLSAKDTLTIQKNCGRDNICIPDLRLIARPSVEKYVLGSGKRLEIEVEVQNEGEDAFESSFELQVPAGLNYVKIERKDESEREIPVQCSPPSFNNNYTLRCDIGNPLPRDKLVRFLVLLQPYHQKTMNSTYEFSMVVNSTNPERNRTVSDNLIHFAVPIWVVTELAISGSSRPVDVYFNSSQYVTDDETKITKESQIGPQVAHLYTIANRGPSEFLKAKATILWPSNTLTGEPLLYLLEEPETSGDIECHVEDDEYNVRKVKIERKGKSFFDAEPGTASAWYSSDYDSESGGSETKSSSSSSSSSWSSSSSSGSKTYLTREERVRFEEEERRKEEEAAASETGDGSHRHGERAKTTHQGKNHYSRNGGRLESDSYSSGSEAGERGRTEYHGRVPEGARRAHEEEHRSYSSSSWSGRDRPVVTKTHSSERTSTTKDGKTETRWREEEDGVVKSGSSVVEHGGAHRGVGSGAGVRGAVDRSFEVSSTRSSNSRTRGGGNADRRVSWRVEGADADGSGGVGTTGSRTTEEKRTEWNTTWASGGRPVTSEHSSWKKEQDGAVVGSTEHSRTYEGDYEASRTGASRVSGYDSRSSSSDRNVNWRVEGDGVAREGSAVAVDDGRLAVTSRRRGHGGGAGTRTKEEKRTEWNTTWSSGGRPVTSEHTSWRKEQDGAVVGSTEHSRTYSGDYEASRTGGSRISGFNARSSSSDRNVNRRVDGEGVAHEGSTIAVDDGSFEVSSRRRAHLGGAGTRTKEEKRTEWNTTWSSGGRPVTSEHSSWKKEQDGAVVGSTEHSRTYEGDYEASRTGASRVSGYDSRSSSSDRNVNWRVEGEGMTREGGTATIDDGSLEVSSRRRGHGAGTKTSEEKRTEWNTTWSSGGRPVTSEHSSWKKEQDGAVVGSTEHSRTYEGDYEESRTGSRSSSSDRNVNWRVEGEGMTREGGTVTVDDGSLEVSSRRRGHGAGTKTSEEKKTEWNTTWSSGDRPVTSEHTSWRKEQDGVVVGSGDHSRTYEGTAERAKAELESRLKEQLDRRITAVSTHENSGTADSEIDQNLISGGGGEKIYKKEWEEHYNTTWGTSTGGKPLTVAKTKWTIEEDGAIKTGGDTKTYEGIAPGTAGTTITFPTGTHQGSARGSGHHSASKNESTHHESRAHIGGVAGVGASGSVDRTESSHSQGGSTHVGARKHHFSTESEGIDVRAGERTGESGRKTYHGSGSDRGHIEASGSVDRTESSHRSEVSRSGSTHTGGRHHFSTESEDVDLRASERAGESGRRTSYYSGGTSSSGSQALGGHHHTESEHRAHGHRSEAESDFTEAERRTQGARAGGSERRTHSSGSRVASSVGESSGASSSFDLGAVARGPGDGKARTYITDLGILDTGASSGSSSAVGSRTVHLGAAGEEESRRHHSGSRERHYSFGGESGAKEGESDSYSSSVHGSSGRSSAGGSYSGGTHYSSGRTYSSGSRSFEGDPDLDPDYESRKLGSSSATSHSYSRSYSSRDGALEGTDDDHRSISNPEERQGFRHYRRDRRETDDYDTYSYDEYEEEASKKCSGPVRCTKIVCNIGALKKDQEVHVAIRSRLWLATIKKIAPHVETVVGSEMTAEVTLLPTIGRPSRKTMTKNSTEIKTRIMTEPLSQPDVVPLWIVVLSAVSGALILMLLVYILYKLGFFKRNRPEPSTGSEKTPLNRNGHYQGDEPL